MNVSRLTVQVTEDDIAKAVVDDSYNCVVAEAIARTVPDSTRIEVDTQAIRFTTDDKRYVFLTPYAVQGYVIAFDAGEHIEPFSFQLRDPQTKQVRRRVRTPEGSEIDKERKRRKYTQKKARDAGTPPPTFKETPRETVAQQAAAEAEARGDSPKAAYDSVMNAPEAPSDRGGRKAPPRVFKTKKRSYGHRVLRINWTDEARIAYADRMDPTS